MSFAPANASLPSSSSTVEKRKRKRGEEEKGDDRTRAGESSRGESSAPKIPRMVWKCKVDGCLKIYKYSSSRSGE